MYLENVKKLVADLLHDDWYCISDNPKVYEQINDYVLNHFLTEHEYTFKLKKKPTQFRFDAWNPTVESWEEYKLEVYNALDAYKNQVEQLIDKDILHDRIKKRKYRDILIKKYGLQDGNPMTFKAIAKIYENSPTRIRELYKMSLRMLRAKLLHLNVLTKTEKCKI